MKSKFVLSLYAISLVITGCAGINSEGNRVIVVNFARSPCLDVQQFANSSDGTLKYAKELEVSGKITQTKAVEIDQRMFFLLSQASTQCNFFNRALITYDQYQTEMGKIREAMLKTENPLPPK